MKNLATLLAASLVFTLASCGGSEPAAKPQAVATTTEPVETTTAPPAPANKGTEIVLGDSQFGSMLYDTSNQAIYIFSEDPKDKTVCYDQCADEWPPVFTDGEPQAGKGVDQSLLGSIKRRGGKSQVTYAGKPLYFYVDEGPGQVLCHNVIQNGGTWWVVGADGKRRP